jgi:hypothetical protein
MCYCIFSTKTRFPLTANKYSAFISGSLSMLETVMLIKNPQHLYTIFEKIEKTLASSWE